MMMITSQFPTTSYSILAHTSAPLWFGIAGMTGLSRSLRYSYFLQLLSCVFKFLINLYHLILVICHVLVDLLFLGLLCLFSVLGSFGRLVCFDFDFICFLFLLLLFVCLFLARVYVPSFFSIRYFASVLFNPV